MNRNLLLDTVRTRVIAAAKAVYHAPVNRLAPWARRAHNRTRFIGITGSAGKTTAKDLTHRILAVRFRTRKSPDSNNSLYIASRAMLTLPPRTEFMIQEVGAREPGSLDDIVRLLAPSVAVVTNVGEDHISAFRSADGVAGEKAKLVRALVPGGTAVLNADDPRVMAMASEAPGPVVTFGLEHGADVHASDIRLDWPAGTSFHLEVGGTGCRVQTRLLGAHLVPGVLAAVAVGRTCGLALEDMLPVIAAFEPVRGRLSHMRTASGIDFLLDDWKAPFWSFPHALAVLGGCQARRKLVVIGTIADYLGSSFPRYRDVVLQAAGVADEILLVGAHANKADRLARRLPGTVVTGYPGPREAADHLRRVAMPGDLVLIKGSNVADHLGRLALQFDRPVTCWQTDCKRLIFCEHCRRLAAAGPED